MKNIDPAYEKKILLDVVEQMQDPEKTQRKQAKAKQIILALGSTGLIIAFFLAINGISHPVIISAIAALAGAFIGFALLLGFVLRQWPITSMHIDMESVNQRLDEL
jgi:hypothetical protein